MLLYTNSLSLNLAFMPYYQFRPSVNHFTVDRAVSLLRGQTAVWPALEQNAVCHYTKPCLPVSPPALPPPWSHHTLTLTLLSSVFHSVTYGLFRLESVVKDYVFTHSCVSLPTSHTFQINHVAQNPPKDCINVRKGRKTLSENLTSNRAFSSFHNILKHSLNYGEFKCGRSGELRPYHLPREQIPCVLGNCHKKVKMLISTPPSCLYPPGSSDVVSAQALP